MKVDVHVVNAFVDGDRGGNPAGVVTDADALSPERKLAVAARVGLSETAFVSKSKSAAIKLEFFTPTRQIAHCGHATIATFSYLRQLGRVAEGRSSKETIDGNRDILLKGDMAFMEQRAPRYSELSPETRRRALASLGLGEEQLAGPLCVVNTGNSFLIVPLRAARAVAALRPDLKAVASVSDELDLIGYYAFSAEAEVAGRDAGARMFAPRYGIDEESATGMAAGPLACYLHDKMRVAKEPLLIEQGRLMKPPSPSVITVELELEGGAVRRLMAGGTAKVMKTVAVEV